MQAKIAFSRGLVYFCSMPSAPTPCMFEEISHRIRLAPQDTARHHVFEACVLQFRLPMFYQLQAPCHAFSATRHKWSSPDRLDTMPRRIGNRRARPAVTALQIDERKEIHMCLPSSMRYDVKIDEHRPQACFSSNLYQKDKLISMHLIHSKCLYPLQFIASQPMPKSSCLLT